MSSNSPIISNFNVITDDILNTNINQLNNGIWYIIDKYKKNYGFLNNYYKEEYSIYNLYFAPKTFSQRDVVYELPQKKILKF